MTSADSVPGSFATWDGTSSATARIAELLTPAAPQGTLRIVLQRLELHDQGAPAGALEVVDAIVDVDGVLVSLSLEEHLRSDAALAARLDSALEQLHADLAAQGVVGADSVELVLDADGERRVRIAFGLEVSPQEARELPRPPAVHDGSHHILAEAPALDALRDRLIAAQDSLPRRLRRTWRRLRRLAQR